MSDVKGITINGKIVNGLKELGFELVACEERAGVRKPDAEGFIHYEYEASDSTVVVELMTKKVDEACEGAILSVLGNFFVCKYSVWRETKRRNMLVEFTCDNEDELVRYLDYIDNEGSWVEYAEEEDKPRKKNNTSKHKIDVVANKFKMNKESKGVFVRGSICIEDDGELILWREDKNGDYVAELETDDLLVLARALKEVHKNKGWSTIA